MSHCLIAFTASLFVAYLLTPLVQRLALAAGAVDHPGQRKLQQVPIPTWGGLAIFGGLLAGGLLTLPLSRTTSGIFFGATLIVAVGMIDDRYEIRPWMKLIGQILAACLLALFGGRILGWSNPLGDWVSFTPAQSWFLTIAWVVVITNTINLIDGMDGLAAGVSAIAAATLALMALQQGKDSLPVACTAAAVCGSAIGFLRYNFNPARIFMGDTGALLLGFMLSSIAVVGTFKSATAVAIVVPVLVLGLPVFDTTFAIIRRLLRGQSIFAADRGHLHHRLMDRGLTHRQVVLVLYAVSGALCALALIIFRARMG